MVRLVTMFAKALFGQVGDHVDQVRDQVGEGQGQELAQLLSGLRLGLVRLVTMFESSSFQF